MTLYRRGLNGVGTVTHVQTTVPLNIKTLLIKIAEDGGTDPKHTIREKAGQSAARVRLCPWKSAALLRGRSVPRV